MTRELVLHPCAEHPCSEHSGPNGKAIPFIHSFLLAKHATNTLMFPSLYPGFTDAETEVHQDKLLAQGHRRKGKSSVFEMIGLQV